MNPRFISIVALLLVALFASKPALAGQAAVEGYRAQACPSMLTSTGSTVLSGTITSFTTNSAGEVISFTFDGEDEDGNPVNTEVTVPLANNNDDLIKEAKRSAADVSFRADWSQSGSNPKSYVLDGGITESVL